MPTPGESKVFNVRDAARVEAHVGIQNEEGVAVSGQTDGRVDPSGVTGIATHLDDGAIRREPAKAWHRRILRVVIGHNQLPADVRPGTSRQRLHQVSQQTLTVKGHDDDGYGARCHDAVPKTDGRLTARPLASGCGGHRLA